MHGLSLIGKNYVVSLLWCKVHVTQGKKFMREWVGTRLCRYPTNTAGTSGMELWPYSQPIVFFIIFVQWRFECNSYIFLVTENG